MGSLNHFGVDTRLRLGSNPHYRNPFATPLGSASISNSTIRIRIDGGQSFFCIKRTRDFPSADRAVRFLEER